MGTTHGRITISTDRGINKIIFITWHRVLSFTIWTTGWTIYFLGGFCSRKVKFLNVSFINIFTTLTKQHQDSVVGLGWQGRDQNKSIDGGFPPLSRKQHIDKPAIFTKMIFTRKYWIWNIFLQPIMGWEEGYPQTNRILNKYKGSARSPQSEIK